MEFSVNSPIIFVLCGIIIAFVLAQAVFFLVRALKRAKEKGMDKNVLRRTIVSSTLFTIAPAIAIVVGVIALSKSLGIAIPWLRLSVIGSLSYETVAAGTTIEALGLGLGNTISDASSFVTVIFVMTIGIILGLILTPLLTKKIKKGMVSIESKDKKWSEILNNAMFLGMISAFLGYVFSDVLSYEGGISFNIKGLIPVCVMVTSAIIMAVVGICSKKFKIRWLTDYALPISLILGMASAIPFTMWLA